MESTRIELNVESSGRKALQIALTDRLVRQRGIVTRRTIQTMMNFIRRHGTVWSIHDFLGVDGIDSGKLPLLEAELTATVPLIPDAVRVVELPLGYANLQTEELARNLHQDGFRKFKQQVEGLGRQRPIVLWVQHVCYWLVKSSIAKFLEFVRGKATETNVSTARIHAYLIRPPDNYVTDKKVDTALRKLYEWQRSVDQQNFQGNPFPTLRANPFLQPFIDWILRESRTRKVIVRLEDPSYDCFRYGALAAYYEGLYWGFDKPHFPDLLLGVLERFSSSLYHHIRESNRELARRIAGDPYPPGVAMHIMLQHSDFVEGLYVDLAAEGLPVRREHEIPLSVRLGPLTGHFRNSRPRHDTRNGRLWLMRYLFYDTLTYQKTFYAEQWQSLHQWCQFIYWTCFLLSRQELKDWYMGVASVCFSISEREIMTQRWLSQLWSYRHHKLFLSLALDTFRVKDAKCIGEEPAQEEFLQWIAELLSDQ